MSMRYLGQSFDLHTGGIDLVFPHHEDEIAQSEAATGQSFVGTWMHCAHLHVSGNKMSKSLGNISRVSDLLAGGAEPRALRLTLISVAISMLALLGSELLARRIGARRMTT